MKLIAFTMLTLAGLGSGLVIGLSSIPPSEHHYYWQQQRHLMQNAIGGTAAGMIAGGIAVWIAGSSSKKD